MNGDGIGDHIAPVSHDPTPDQDRSVERDVELPVRARRRGDGFPLDLSDGDVAEYRRRIIAGVYRSPAIVDAVARRIVESGDL